MGCGKPDIAKLQSRADDINNHAKAWWAGADHAEAIAQLREVLACSGRGCTTIDSIPDSAKPCSVYDEKCSSPLRWEGKFSYASTATEVFLLEYANSMPERQVG